MSSDSEQGIEKYVRSHLKDFTGYTASISPDTISGKIEVPPGAFLKMNANENPYGCSPRVLKALSDGSRFSVYPDNGQRELRKW